MWRGTFIPNVANPLRATPARRAIALRVWWRGPPWTVLRNSSRYLWQVWDYASDADIDFTLDDVPTRRWLQALDEARPGRVSCGSYVLWSYVFGRISGEEICDWPRDAHHKDWRPTARDSRETLYARAAAHHGLMAAAERPP